MSSSTVAMIIPDENRRSHPKSRKGALCTADWEPSLAKTGDIREYWQSLAWPNYWPQLKPNKKNKRWRRLAAQLLRTTVSRKEKKNLRRAHASTVKWKTGSSLLSRYLRQPSPITRNLEVCSKKKSRIVKRWRHTPTPHHTKESR